MGVLVFCISCGKTKKSPEPTETKESVELTFWNTMSDSEAQTLAEYVETFSTKHPHIQVKTEQISFWQAQTKFEQAAAAGIPPDIMRADRFWIDGFVNGDLLQVLDSVQEETDDCLPIALQAVTRNGKVWGLPQSVDCLALFYNKEHFQEAGCIPPENLDQFRETAKKNTETSKGRYGFFMNPDGWYFEPFLGGFGGRYFDADGKLAIKSDQTLKAVHFLLDLKDSQRVLPPVNLRTDTYNTMMRSFKNGQVSMIFNGPWAIRNILEGSAFKDKTENLGVAPVPKGPSGRSSPVGCQSYVIAKGARHPKEALELVRYLCSREVQSGLSKTHFGIPARKSLFLDPELRRDPFLSPFLLQVQECRELNSNPAVSRFFKPVTEYLTQVMNGDVSPEDGLRDLESQWKK